jgi:hypothetical protein
MDWFQLQYRRGAGNEYSANPELPGADGVRQRVGPAEPGWRPAIEWAPQGTPPPGSNFIPDPAGPTFEQAIADQVGLMFQTRRSSMEVFAVDRVERPRRTDMKRSIF